jgi:hypothetical protein
MHDMTDIQFRSFGEVFAAKLAEQGIDVDPANLPVDPSECDAFLQGDGTHLAGTVFETYVEAWGWETLQPLLETALANTAGIEWVEQTDGTGDGGEYGASDRDAQATWVYNLLGAAGLDNLGLDPYDAPDAANVAAFIQGDFADPNTWPALAQALESMEADQREQSKQALRSAVDQVGSPPASQW